MAQDFRRDSYNVGLIGYQFMGKAHSNAYRQVNRFFEGLPEVRMRTLCGRNEEAVTRAANTYGWERIETDWRKVVADPEIHIVDVSTPGNLHAEIAIAAAEAGKIVFCEKPIGNTLEEAERMLAAVERAGVQNAVFHNYRKAPAVGLAKRLIEAGRLGRIYHWRAVYLQDWIADPSFPLVWRLQKAIAGSGTHGDINAHIIDLARHLVGEIAEVSGLLHTFIKERPVAGAVDDRLGAAAGETMGEVTVDDAAMFLARFKEGALGTFEATRFAVGRKNKNSFEINGSKGSLVFDLERMNELQFFDNELPSGEAGFRLIQATEGDHPWAGKYWPAGHIIGYEHTFINTIHDLLQGHARGQSPQPDFRAGAQVNAVLDAVVEASQKRSWVTIEQL